MRVPESLRIALVASGGFDRGGRERVTPVLLSLVERLARQHTVTVYVLDYLPAPQTYALCGATIRDLGRPRGMTGKSRALIAALREDGVPDVVHGHLAMPSGAAAVLAGRRLGVPSVVTIDSGELVSLPDIDYGLQRRWRHRAVVSATMRLAGAVVVTTGYMEQLASEHRVAPVRIPLGVDTARFVPPDAPPPGPPWRLLHVASLNPVKDQATLLRAFRLVADRVDARLDLAGEDTMSGAIQSLARQLGIADRVAFHGFCAHEQLVDLYQRAHLVVVSSRHEAGGIAALEAAACGVAVVGTAVGHVADWSPDRAVGVAPGDAQALAGAIVDLLDTPARRATLAAAARTWVLAHDVGWTAARLTGLYRELQESF